MKVLRINTRTAENHYEPFKEECKVYGQRGLIDKFIEAELDPKCDPLGPDNKLFIVTGVFAGTGVPSSGRISGGAKSPLTGTIKESTSGGMIGPYMTSQEIKGIILEDQPAADAPWQVIKIDPDGKVDFLPADEYMGKNTYEVSHMIQHTYGDKAGALVLGRAGEMGYKVASIMSIEFNTGHPCRAMGRGGLGAVLGSKKIKAIIMEKPNGKYAPPYVDKAKFEEDKKGIATVTKENPKCQGFTTKGTAGFLTGTNQTTRAIPIQNFRGGAVTPEQREHFGPEAWEAKNKVSGGHGSVPCHPGCVMRCSNIYNDPQGNHITSGLEYETVSLFCPNCLIWDFDVAARLDRLCDEMGIDTIEAGNLIAICMDGGVIEWGDGDGAIKLLEGMSEGTELGRIMGQGTVPLGKHLGVTRVPQCKGQSFAAYDPRTQPGGGIAYALSPQGADHSVGQVVAPDKNNREILAMAGNRMLDQCIVDNFGCTLMNAAYFGQPRFVPDLYEGLFGGEWDKEKLYEIGREMFRIERKFNKEAGFGPEDDMLPDFCVNEANPANDNKFDLTVEELEEVFRPMGACYDQL